MRTLWHIFWNVDEIGKHTKSLVWKIDKFSFAHSQKIPEEFLNGTIDLDKFLETFTSKRILMHLRRIKADKMAEMLTKRNSFGSPAGAQNNSGFNSSNNSGFNGSFGAHIPYNTPYPMSGSGMPLPNIPMTPYPSIPSMPAPSYNHFWMNTMYSL